MAYLVHKKVLLLMAVAVSILAAGCKAPDLHDATLDSSIPKDLPPVAPVPIEAIAGLPVRAGQATTAKMVVSVRADPFALMPNEEAYEKQQLAANLATNYGTFPMFYEAPPEEETAPEVEPQPYRRLAGILIGDSVTALIDMGTGGPPVSIHPGMIIPGTNWMVVSIDEEKAVLRRVNSNRLPSEIIVRLEVAPPGSQTQQPAPGNEPNNGFGGPPPGFGAPGQGNGPINPGSER
ncbi:MAG TPA: hypothetical protein VGL56_06650 [Fimbriimonadaceae bacterium]|jgi:hypothetical protein